LVVVWAREDAANVVKAPTMTTRTICFMAAG
jgi:hypothetical protein